MRLTKIVTLFTGLFVLSSAASAEHHKEGQEASPKLVVAISVDQFSSDLFSEYRSTFRHGMKRLAGGAVFPSGYQAHAATETCPGHATIMTGSHPGRAGIIANNWIDLRVARDDKTVYCAEDERVEGTSFGAITAATQGPYIASAWHLLVPTLGERLKATSPQSRNVAVAGKDRSALMMGGTDVDAVYWWKRKGFATLSDREVGPPIAALNARIADYIDQARAPYPVPDHCAARNNQIVVSDNQSVGTYDFRRPEGTARIFRGSPDFDKVTIEAAMALIDSMKLGQGEVTDVLSVGLAATDYIGHAFGTGGLEMCIQMAQLDRNLGLLFEHLDAAGMDYVAVLTADHGGHDLPERLRLQGVPDAERIDPNLNAKFVGKQVKDILKDSSDVPVLHADSPFGDYYVSLDLPAERRAEVKKIAMMMFAEHPQVEAVFDHDMLSALPMPKGPPEEWTMAERTRASFHPDRSGDFIVLLKKAVTPIASGGPGYVATHGSPWDYDRQVPILFWHKDLAHFEQPLSVRTVDIAPTLAALIGVEIPADEIDGKCLDIDGGKANSCER
ncbi:Predicted pyrophosphatase or phosphodiesterase, AlkP superfamily [Parasphingorhabdus marina DSM 22363]|uniref:Alkaline phosphatase n=1 Tax=Parasphingorhabdus marina DSM 22363 TaxID=1123272 RepID=A0A1N6HAF0_9SPHN|nr:alkaline phosphatase family protein [Parasphingorhabdus marina]SIO16723.1 Predicted pyrophosphatase or phosphodiesterase, AlkP superfamily [Parasphingorhabdus marina DSM 22363]